MQALFYLLGWIQQKIPLLHKLEYLTWWQGLGVLTLGWGVLIFLARPYIPWWLYTLLGIITAVWITFSVVIALLERSG
jgi:hypothetical protein